MIPFASQRGGGQDLATHLLNAYDNEIAEVVHMRGAIARDLHGAFKEWEVQADTLTRCEKFLYSLSINPDPRQGPLTREQYMDYIGRTEEVMGLKDQPRAIVFHTKYGREHCHVVWSRIDAQRQKAVHLAFDHDKLMEVTRSFARDHGLKLPKGYEKSERKGQESLYEREQQRRTGLSKEDHVRQVTAAWQQSDNARAFIQALSERGYLLAKGRRDYILVDLYGGNHSLPKLIDDKAVRTAQVRAFLEKDFPVHGLPSVEEAEALVAAHRKLVEQSLQEEQYADALTALKQSQQERRAGIAGERRALALRQQQARAACQAEHRQQRETLRRSYQEKRKDIRAARHRDRPNGLAAFLGRVTGVEWVRKAVHRHQDLQRLKTFREAREALKIRQQREVTTLDQRLTLQVQEVERKERALTRIDRRELAAFMRDQRKEQRVHARGSDGVMPSLAETSGILRDPKPIREIDLLSSFNRARDASTEVPDLLAAFSRAGREQEGGDRGTSACTLDQAQPGDARQSTRKAPERDPNRGRER